MGIGPKDAIDKKLAKMYSKKQTANFDVKSAVDANTMLEGMNMMSLNNKLYFNIRRGNGLRKSDLSTQRKVGTPARQAS